MEWPGIASGVTTVNPVPENGASPEPRVFWAALRSLGLILKDGTQSRRVNIVIRFVALKRREDPWVGNGYEEPEGVRKTA